jgi:hypothetical protein
MIRVDFQAAPRPVGKWANRELSERRDNRGIDPAPNLSCHSLTRKA